MERYNREFGDLFDKKHPSLLEFTETLDEEMDWRIKNLNDARKGKYHHGTERRKIAWPKIPKDFGPFKREYENKGGGYSNQTKEGLDQGKHFKQHTHT